MDTDCIFCKIIAGDIPCSKVFESERILAFLDIAPVNKGHALVIPKEHHPQVWDLPDDLAADLLAAQKAVGRALMETTGADGLNIMMNNHAVAGQLVMHAHYHLIPRFEADGLELWPGKAYADMDEMNSLADEVRGRIK